MELLECTDYVSNDDENHPYCIIYNERNVGKYYVFSLTRTAASIHRFIYVK